MTQPSVLPRPSPRRIVHLTPGQKLGRYEVLGEIGHGGMATVYRARDIELERVVALKVLPMEVTQDERFVSRFLHEARSVARLSHPSIVQVHDVGQDHGAWYISMELVPGQNLSEYLRLETPNLHQSVTIAAQIADAIAYTHQHGVMHRDIKPSNVLMRGDLPVVIDFGLSKDLVIGAGSILTRDGEMVGSPAYMSPEQARGDVVDQASDVCSLGIVLYELISFKNPYLDPRSIHQTVLNVISAHPVPLRELCPWVDRGLDAVVACAMARDKVDRYPDMASFAADLQAWLAGRPLSVRPPGVVWHIRHWMNNHSMLLWGLGLTALFASVGAGYLKLQERLARTPWAVVAEETFEGPMPSVQFPSFRTTITREGPRAEPSTDWKIESGRLIGSGEGLTFVRSVEEFHGDMRVEFTIEGLDGHNHDFGAFLKGDAPWSGKRYILGRWGRFEGGIEEGDAIRHRLQRLPLDLVPGQTYRVRLERIGETLRLWVDGVLVDEVVQALPRRDRTAWNLGFYTWNGRVAIDDLRIERRTVALRASPTVVAEAFLDEGLVNHAIRAYEAVIKTYPGHEVAQEARLELGGLLLARGSYKQALDMLESVEESDLPGDLRPRYLLLNANAQRAVGDLEKSQSFQQRLVRLAPRDPANVALIQDQLLQAEKCLSPVTPLFFGCAMETEAVFRFLAQQQPRHQDLFGPTHLRFAEALRLWGRSPGDSSFLRTALQFDQYYAGSSPDLAAGLWIVRGRMARDKGRDDDAIRIFRQVADGTAYGGATYSRMEAAIELGRTLGWSNRGDEAAGWFDRVARNPAAPADLAGEAMLKLAIATILGRQDPSPILRRMVDRPALSWQHRQVARFLLGQINGDELLRVMRVPGEPEHGTHLLLAIRAWREQRWKEWRDHLDQYVRAFPYSTGTWEFRRILQWAMGGPPLGAVITTTGTARDRRR